MTEIVKRTFTNPDAGEKSDEWMARAECEGADLTPVRPSLHLATFAARCVRTDSRGEGIAKIENSKKPVFIA